ncbi:hypothetical protein PROFUN_10563 [Planoprotostelium fungivorum]|uniref:Peptidase S53 domain-containing protein n=1 Tax=Planoprotostelium fungivorum TaxID=1890364 RepID=A0A2P6N6U7_9EUKA|nr:hypothetical protein PROFUN_10563 [Planoprotostelium fungivorum]
MRTTLVLLALLATTVAFWHNTGRAQPQSTHTVTFAVRQINNAAATCDSLIRKTSEPSSRHYGQHKSLSQVNAIFLNREAVRRVESWLATQGHQFETIGDYIKVTSSISNLETLLSAKFHAYRHFNIANKIFYKTDAHTVPIEIANDVEFVLNVDLPRVIPHSFTRSKSALVDADGNTTPSVINTQYGITNNTVTSATQSLFEALGQNFSPDDLSAFQQQYQLPNIPISKVTGNNDGSSCSDNPDACGEANLDVQYMLAVAQSTETHYRVIDQGSQDPFYDWIIELSQATDTAHVHSVSYGSLAPEDPKTDMQRFNTEVCKLGLRGVTIVVASGDDGVANFPARQDPSQCGFVPSFPATSPYVLAVGATMGPEAGNPEIACTSDAGGLITTGGGFSVTFNRPSYQDKAVQNYLANAPNLPDQSHFAVNGRAYPDVAALGHNYVIIDGGSQTVVSGTSASAPVFAAILTLVNDQRLLNGKTTLGFVNPALYKAPASLWTDITSGRNNCAAGQEGSQVCCDEGFTATTGWDPLTGLGSPKFEQLNAYLGKL